MIVIIGLGNPGKTYTYSRHNIGFGVVEEIAERLSTASWKEHNNLQAEIYATEKVILVKPQTFMNRSGKAAQAVLKKYDYTALGKKELSRVFVVYDDLDLPVGKYKLVFGVAPKVHNGIKSVMQELGTADFWHVRIGVDGRNGDRSLDPQDYVLSGFSDSERELVDKTVDAAVDILTQKITTEAPTPLV